MSMSYEVGVWLEKHEASLEKHKDVITKLATRMTAIEAKLGLKLREEAEEEETTEMELPKPKAKKTAKKTRPIEDDQDPPQEMPELPKIDLGDLGL